MLLKTKESILQRKLQDSLRERQKEKSKNGKQIEVDRPSESDILNQAL